jgi:mRNA-degrading endonuclease RelE of RelBE toxin-antitoxin system
MEKKYKSLDMKVNKLVQTGTNKSKTDTQFYRRLVNKTSISLSDEEFMLLNKGLKYNLNQKRKHWLSNLASEAKAAITLLPAYEQEHIRYHVAYKLQKLHKQHNDRHTVFDKTTKNEIRTVNQIKKKLIENKAMITKAGKGNSVIILYIDDYNNKVDKFISNNFTLSNLDITNKLQRDIRTKR